MRNTYLFDVLDGSRIKLADLAGKVPADKRDTVPNGCNNNIRWQFGHILASADTLLHRFTDQEFMLPEIYRKSFGSGSKPADWNPETPDWDTILEQLREQPAKIRAKFEGKLNDPVSENFAKAQTVEEMLNILLNHESLHTGQIGAMLRMQG